MVSEVIVRLAAAEDAEAAEAIDADAKLVEFSREESTDRDVSEGT